MTEGRSSVVLADDHAVVRNGPPHAARARRHDGGRRRGGRRRRRAALRRGHKPDVLVLDLNMPGRDSLEAIPDILEASPATHIVVLTMQPDPAFARAALRAGAVGYILKEAAHEELLRAIESARQGRTYVDPSVGARLASAAGQPPGRPDGLSHREAEVLERIVLGETNAEVAAALQISVRTVETHRAHIQQKTNCSSRSALVRYAREHGLVG